MAIALVRELIVWSNLRHTNILPFVGYFLDPRLEGAWLVAPFMRNGNLSDYLRRERPDQDACIQLLNVLIADDRRAVLCDFGLAKTMESMPSGLTTSTFNQGGSLPYESPELLLGESLRAQESDVWAWACVLQEVFSGKYPYYWANNPGAIVKWIIQDIPPATVDEIQCPTRVRRLLTRCWQGRPALRPTMTQCIAILTGGEDTVDETLEPQEGVLSLEALWIKRSDLSYDATTLIGSGRFGTVYRATLREVLGSIPGEVVAVKELFHVFDEISRARLERILLSWGTLKHPNVLPFRGFCEGEGKVLLISPHQPGGSLAAYLERGSLTYTRRMDLATETAQGLLYLHTRDPPIFHGNIHLGNVFVSTNGTPLLSDYGISTVVKQTNVATLNQTDEKPRYQSPEVLTKASQPTAPSDVWSWSCLFLKIVTGKTPYESVIDTNSLAEHIRHNRALPATIGSLDCPPRAQNIMGHCWKLDPELRPPIGEVLAILNGQAFRFEKVTDITVAQNSLNALVFSNDGNYIAMVLDEVVQVISTDTWKIVMDLACPERFSGTWSVRFSPSNRFFALGPGGRDYPIWVWDLRTGKLHKTLLGMDNIAWGVDIAADDTFVVASSRDGDVRLWRLDDNKEGTVLQSLASSTGVAVAISPKCDLVAVGFERDGLRVWDKQRGTLLATLEGGSGALRCTQFSSDGCWLFGCTTNGEVRRWDVSAIWKEKSEASCTVYRLKQGNERISALSVSPDNTWFAAISSVHGDVNVVQFSNPDSTHSSVVGKVPADGIWSRVSLGPMSNHTNGLAAGGSGGGMTVYKYASWDIPGTYLV
ncbi:hypothetical protein FRB99_005017 [Tulasnella sp. 403]|nr:hypothetical protein FRB99_005017 [Tulasnella sp. 403]